MTFCTNIHYKGLIVDNMLFWTRFSLILIVCLSSSATVEVRLFLKNDV